MLPPINAQVLERNPRFKVLYQDLTTSRINPDGSSRLLKQQRAQADLEKSLTVCRRDQARSKILRDALEASVTRSDDLPDETLQSCRIVAAMLDGDISSSDLEILQGDVDRFVSNIPQISTLVAAYLIQSAKILTAMCPPTVEKGPSASTRFVEVSQSQLHPLSVQVLALSNSISSQTAAITTTRLRITELADQIHNAHRDILEAAVRILEQVVQGSIVRGMKAKAEHLSAVAKAMDMKIRILAKTDPLLNDPSLTSALKAYSEHLGSMIENLTEKAEDAETELKEYDDAGKGMEQIAARYAELMRESERLKSEIQRLEGKEDDH